MEGGQKRERGPTERNRIQVAYPGEDPTDRRAGSRDRQAGRGGGGIFQKEILASRPRLLLDADTIAEIDGLDRKDTMDSQPAGAGGAALEVQKVHFQDLAHPLTVPISKECPSLGEVSAGFLAPEPNLRHAANVSPPWNTWGPS